MLGAPPAQRALALCKPKPSCSASSLVQHALDAEDEPLCRYCWGAAADDFVAPCGCTGTTQFVHYRCLVRWCAAGLANRRKHWSPTQCEICRQRWFGGSRQHQLLLETAHTELQLSQLYSAAQHGAEMAALVAAPPSASRPWVQALAHGYWGLALRPLQAAMLVQSCLSQQGLPGVARALAVNAASWLAARMCEQWVRAFAGLGRWGHTLVAVGMFAHGAGSSLHGWLQGRCPGGSAFHLRLPLSLPCFPAFATALAGLGALLPGRFRGADGMRAAALAPLLVLRWALTAGGPHGGLLGAACRLLAGAAAHLRGAAKCV